MPSVNFDHKENLIYVSDDDNELVWDETAGLDIESSYAIRTPMSFNENTGLWVSKTAFEKDPNDWNYGSDYTLASASKEANFVVIDCIPSGTYYTTTIATSSVYITKTIESLAEIAYYNYNTNKWSKANYNSLKTCATHLLLKTADNKVQLFATPMLDGGFVETAIMDSDNPSASQYSYKYLITRDATHSAYLYMKSLYPDLDTIFDDAGKYTVIFTLDVDGKVKIWNNNDNGYKQRIITFHKGPTKDACYFVVTIYEPLHVSYRDGGKFIYDAKQLAWVSFDGEVYSDYLAPSTSIGKNGDYYLQKMNVMVPDPTNPDGDEEVVNEQEDLVYIKENGLWELKGKNSTDTSRSSGSTQVYIWSGYTNPVIGSKYKTGDIYLRKACLMLEPVVIFGDGSEYNSTRLIPNLHVWYDSKNNRIVYKKYGSIYYILPSGSTSKDTTKYIRTNMMMDMSYLIQPPMSDTDFRYD